MKRQRLILLILVILLVATTLVACDLFMGTPPSTPDCANGIHVDRNNDGKCDLCFDNVMVEFYLVAINDMHGRFLDTETQPGVDELSTYVKNLRAESNTILLSSGDMWQGSAESVATKGALVNEWMNEMDFVSMTLGNHEFDWGESAIRANNTAAEFPYLAINVFDRATNRRVDYCSPSVYLDYGAYQVGIIGAIGDCYSSIAADKTQGIYFKTGDELTALVKAEAQSLRARGADFIVYSLHDGTDGCSSDLTKGYVDIVFEGHSHRNYTNKDGNGAYHLQAGAEGDGVSQAKVFYNLANGKSRVSAEFVPNSKYQDLDSDTVVETLVAKYADKLDGLFAPIGYNSETRNSEWLKELIAKLYLDAGMEKWGDAFDIVLGGGYLNVRNPYYLAMGDVTYSDLAELFPFDNRIQLCSISGADLLRRFINNDNYLLEYSAYGNTVKNNLNSNATYYVVTDGYNSVYEPNRLTVVADLDDEIFARDLLAKHVADGNLGERPIEDYTLTSIADALRIGNALQANEKTTEQYYVAGVVDSITNNTYGNMYLKDGEGRRIYVYGTYDHNGKRFDAMAQKPVVGDRIVLRGQITNYARNATESVVELVNATLIEILAECVSHVDSNGDGLCDDCGQIVHSHVDQNHDGVCDDSACGAKGLPFVHVDQNEDCICDVCNRPIPHVDSNGDGLCDVCLVEITLHCHVDDNNDGVCDSCLESVIVRVNILSMNDTHGKFYDTETQPGVDELSTYIGNLRASANTIVLSSGDMWQGSIESIYTEGAIFTEWMNAMDFSAMALGNHEFDWGDDIIVKNARLADFPILGINVFSRATNKRVDYCSPSVLLDYGEYQIGVIGAIGDCYSSIAADKTQGVYFKVGAELTALVKAEAQSLRARGADLVVYLLHDGVLSESADSTAVCDLSLTDNDLNDDGIPDNTGYVDVVFEAHTHNAYCRRDDNGAYHLQAGAEGYGISRIDVELNIANGKSIVVNAEVVRNSAYRNLSPSPIVDEVKEAFIDVVGPLFEVIGVNETVRSSDTLRQLSADLYLQKGVAEWGDDYDIVFGGGYTSVRSPYQLSAGNVTYADIAELFPFNNNLQLCAIKGKNLKKYFINNTSGNYFLSFNDGWSETDNYADETIYYIVIDTYGAHYKPNDLHGATTIQSIVADLSPVVYARDLIADYIRAGGYGSVICNVHTDANHDGNCDVCGMTGIQVTHVDVDEDGVCDVCGREYLRLDGYTLTSIVDVLTDGESLAVGASTAKNYYVRGTVDSIVSATYGNMYLVDGNGNRIYVYGLYDADGVRYDSMTNKPAVGDTIVVWSVLYNYSGTLELKNATLVSISDETPQGELRVYYFDVGQGDCILIIFPDGKEMLIDSGDKQNPVGFLDEYVTDGQIDYMMLTHGDQDHVEYLDDVLAAYDVDNIYMPFIKAAPTNATLAAKVSALDAELLARFTDKDTLSTACYANFFIAALQEPDANIYMNVGDIVIRGDDYTFTFYCYDEATWQAKGLSSSKNKNAISPIGILEYGGRKLVFTGDSVDTNEQMFVDRMTSIDCDVLKVAHHGGETSSIPAFLQCVDCEYAVISCNAVGNTYKHPRQQTLDNLATYGTVNLYRTDLQGTISLAVTSLGDIIFETERTLSVEDSARLWVGADQS